MSKGLSFGSEEGSVRHRAAPLPGAPGGARREV